MAPRPEPLGRHASVATRDADPLSEGGGSTPLPFDSRVVFVYGIARSRVMILGLTVLGALVGLVIGASMPNVYTSEAKLRNQASARQMITDETVMGVADDEWSRRRTAPGILDLIDLLRDPAIYERVARELGPREVLRVEDPSRSPRNAGLAGSIMHQLQGVLIRFKGLDNPCANGEGPLCQQTAVKTLLGSVEILPVKDTNLLHITYTASSPQKAQLVLNALIEGFLQHHIDVFGASGKLAELKEQFDNEHQKLTQLNNEYRAYQEECGFWDIDGDYLDAVAALRLRDANIAQLEVDGKRLSQYVTTLEGQLNGDSSALGGKALNPYWEALVKRRQEALAVIADLESRPSLVTTAQRQLEAARTERSAVEGQLLETPQFTSDPYAAALAAQNNPVIAEAQLELAKSKSNLAALADQVAEERKQKLSLEQRLKKIRECQPQHELHRATLDNAQKKFTRISQQIPELDTLALLDQEGRSNLARFREASLPFEKDGPNRTKPLGLGLFGGLVLGICFAALRQLSDRRIRYRETIEREFDLNVLCVVPEVAGLEDGRHVA